MALAALAALAIALRALLPWAIARGIESQARSQLALPLRLANVDLWLFDGAVALEGLVVGRPAATPEAAASAPDPGDALLRLARVFVHLDWRALLERRVHLRALAIEGPQLRLERDAQGRIDPLGLPAAEPEPRAGEPPEPWSYAVDRFDLRGLELELADLATQRSPLELSLARLSLTEIAIDGSALGLGGVEIEGPRLRIDREFSLGGGGSGGVPAEASPPPGERAAPLTLALESFDLRDLALELRDPATQRTPAEFTLARLSLADVALDETELILGAIELQSPALRIDRDFALDGVRGDEAAGEAALAAGTPERPTPLAVQLERIAVVDATFTLRTEAGAIEVAIRLDAEQVNARSGVVFPIDLDLGIEGGKLALQGKLGLNPLAYDGNLVWSDLLLPPLGVVARPELEAWVRTCRADGDFTLSLRTTRDGDAAPGLRLVGAAKLRELLLADPSDQELSVGWKELELVVREAFLPIPAAGEEPSTARVSLERVRLVEPDVVYTLPSAALDELLGGGEEPPPLGGGEEPPPAGAARDEPGAPPLELLVDALDVEGGRVRFRDQTVSPAVETRIRDLVVAVREAGLPEPHAESIHATGIIPDTAPFSLVGSLKRGSGKLRLKIDRLSLQPLAPYAAAAGYDLGGGQASLDTTLRIRGERNEFRNRLVGHRLAISSRDASAFKKRFGMTLDVALALLRDLRGDIRLSIPFVIDAEGSRTGVATVVQGALRQALVGALSAPLKLVGAVLPTGRGGEASLEPLAAVPGQAELRSDSDPRLKALARLLAERPALGLRLRGGVGPEDRRAIAEQILVERATAGAALPEVEGAGSQAEGRIAHALAAVGRAEQAALTPEDHALLERMVGSVDVPPARLQELAQRRAEAVREALATQHGVAAWRLPIAKATEDGEPAVAVELAAAGPAP